MASKDGNPGAQAALDILGSDAEKTYNNFTIYERAVFVNTTAAIADAKLDLTGVRFGGFYSGKKSKPAFGIVLDGVTNSALDTAGLTRGVGGRRSPRDIPIASLEATTNYKGRANSVAFDVDLYNVRARPISHWREVGFNRRHGFTTQPADVARALVARGVITGVRTR